MDIKSRKCYSFDDVIKIQDFNFGNILIYEKLDKNILIYDTSSKTLIDANLLSIFFNKIDGLIRVYDETRYLVIFGPEKYNTIWNNIRHLLGQKSSTCYFS